jgi:hypothetical protein
MWVVVLVLVDGVTYLALDLLFVEVGNWSCASKTSVFFDQLLGVKSLRMVVGCLTECLVGRRLVVWEGFESTRRSIYRPQENRRRSSFNGRAPSLAVGQH